MASTALRRPIGHEDRLSLIEHLDELRSRLIISLAILVGAVALCFAFNGTLLEVINRPLDRETQKNVAKGRGPLGQLNQVARGVKDVGAEVDGALAILSRDENLSARSRAGFQARRAALRAKLARLPRITGKKPVTL